jgi:SAM-dependent methyltransferase
VSNDLPVSVIPPDPAHIYDYWLGGKDHYAADRQVGDRVIELAPWVVIGARACRSFLGQEVTVLAEAGIRQFIDIGSGLPTAGNVHEIAQRVNPQAHIMYVDNSPVVLARATALMAGDGGVKIVYGDARKPHEIIEAVKATGHIDLTQPVAVLFSAVLHFLTAEDDPEGVVAAFRDVMAPGSYLLISHVVADDDDRGPSTRAAAAAYTQNATSFVVRTTDQIAALFDGFEVVEPGLHALTYHGEITTVVGGVARLQVQ